MPDLRRPLGPALLVLGLLLAACGGSPRLARPKGLAVAADGSLYALEAAKSQILHLSAAGQIEQSFPLPRPPAGQIDTEWDLAVDLAGNLYTCVQRQDAIQTIHDGVNVYAPDGRFLREIGGHDYAAGETARKPYGLDVDGAGRVYVADYLPGTVRVFDAQGQLLTSLFGPDDPAYRFQGLNDVAVDLQRHWLYAVDQDGQSVIRFRLTELPGGIVTATEPLVFGGYGQGLGQVAFPQYLAVDERTGNVYVDDLANRRVEIFTAQGDPVGAVAPQSVPDWDLMGLALSADGTLFASDMLNGAIWTYAGGDQFLRRLEVR